MRRLLPALPALALLISLAPAAPVPVHLMPKTSPAYYPTAAGTRLVYDRNGTEETVVVSHVEEKPEGRLVTTENVSAGGKRTPHQKVLVGDKGLFLVEETGEAYDPPWLVLRLPHEPGSKWETDTTRGRGLRIVSTTTAGEEQRVRVPAGDFTAVRVDWDWTGRVTAYWYARGVGLVRLDAGGQVLVLKSFTPGK